jgi:putative PIN family toxin of toxin-antitoxin system
MNEPMKVVFDNSVLVSAVLRPSSDSATALCLVAAHRAIFYTCEAGNEELRRIVNSDKLDEYLRRETRVFLAKYVRDYSLRVDLTDEDFRSVSPQCQDIRDNLFLALAKKAGAKVIVSGDEHLLAMNPWNGIRIIMASQFVSEEKLARSQKRSVF